MENHAEEYRDQFDDERKVRICTKVDRGRWRKEEHDLFLKGLELYGRDWKKIESLVGTRTGPQIRSHAQKYFNKVSKEKGISSETLSSNKVKNSPLSSPSHSSNNKSYKGGDTTNMRKRKEEDKLKELEEAITFEQTAKKVQKEAERVEKLRIPIANLNNLNLNPLHSEENHYVHTPNTLDNANLNLNTKEYPRMYTEEEVLMLIKHIVKEFASLMNRFGLSQSQGMTNNLGMLNLNSMLLLSLMTQDQNKPSFTSPVSNIVQQNIHAEKLTSINNFPTFNLADLLKCQLPKDSATKISFENLSKLPNKAGCVPTQILGNSTQSQNSYSGFQKFKPSGEGVKSPAIQLKRYDSGIAETKDDSDTYPTLEARVDQN
jgi:SHAQKYF class myb-like DNA-binding protein